MRAPTIALMLATLAVLPGCAATGGKAANTAVPAAAMPPETRAALDRLAPFVGRWTMEGTIRRPGAAPKHFSGTNEARWEADGTLLVAFGAARIGDGPPNHALAAWSWDAVAGLYRGVMLDSTGATGVGTSTFDETTRTWHGRQSVASAAGTLRLTGEVRFLDARTKEEHWTAYDDGNQVVWDLLKTERRR